MPGALPALELGPHTTIELRRRFHWVAQHQENARVWLTIDGLFPSASVFLNGNRLGDQDHAWTRFRRDVTLLLRPESELLIEWPSTEARGKGLAAGNPLTAAAESPAFSGHGMLGGAWLSIESSELSWRRISFQAEGADGNGRIILRGRLNRGVAPDGRRWSLIARLRNRVVGERELADSDLDAPFMRELEVSKVAPWTEQEPTLYSLSLSLTGDGEEIDVRDADIGFRHSRPGLIVHPVGDGADSALQMVPLMELVSNEEFFFESDRKGRSLVLRLPSVGERKENLMESAAGREDWLELAGRIVGHPSIARLETAELDALRFWRELFAEWQGMREGR